jgi:hypothetical protein
MVDKPRNDSTRPGSIIRILLLCLQLAGPLVWLYIYIYRGWQYAADWIIGWLVFTAIASNYVSARDERPRR